MSSPCVSHLQVTELVDKHRQPKEACKAILQAALAAWRCVGAGDNIAVLVVRFAWDGQQQQQQQQDDASFLSTPILTTAHDVPLVCEQASPAGQALRSHALGG